MRSLADAPYGVALESVAADEEPAWQKLQKDRLWHFTHDAVPELATNDEWSCFQPAS
jgi:hypothetical protein